MALMTVARETTSLDITMIYQIGNGKALEEMSALKGAKEGAKTLVVVKNYCRL